MKKGSWLYFGLMHYKIFKAFGIILQYLVFPWKTISENIFKVFNILKLLILIFTYIYNHNITQVIKLLYKIKKDTKTLLVSFYCAQTVSSIILFIWKAKIIFENSINYYLIFLYYT